MSSQHNEGNPHNFDSDSDHRSLLSIFGWALGVMTAVIVASRVAVKLMVSRTFALDDVFIIISIALALAQTGVLSTAVSHGFGLMDGGLQTAFETQAKDIYIFNILFVFSQVFAKISIICFIRLLTPVAWHLRVCWAILIASVFWGCVAVFALAFQCHLPHPWHGSGTECVNRRALLAFIEVFNIMLDASLIVFPSLIVWKLQQRKKRRLLIIATFCSRIGVIVATLIQIVVTFEPQGVDGQENPFLSWTYALTTQIVEYFSIVSACGPYMKPLLESMSSGWFANDDIARRTMSSYGPPLVKPGFVSRHRHRALSIDLRRLQPGAGINETTIVANRASGDARSSRSWDRGSQRSTARFIRQTTTYQVTHELAVASDHAAR